MSGKILFLGPHRPNRNGSQRFRMEQFFPYLRSAGFQCDYSWFLNEHDDQIFYSPGHWTGKLTILFKAIRTRLHNVIRANHYDLIFIQREAFMTGSVFFEKRFSRSRAKLVFDFDDAIWLEDISASNKKLSWLKRPQKTADIITISDAVITGNSFLAAYARQFNSNVYIIPTVIDTSVYIPSEKQEKQVVCIGWSGSKTTIKHFAILLPVLKKLKEKYGDKIQFMQIGDKTFNSNDPFIESSDWRFDNEVEELNKIDIGLMPLPNDDWSRGKCSFKALQYMALETPPVISPVGMNKEIIEDGRHGFFAKNDEEWLNCIGQLIESRELRLLMGKTARQRVIERYSVQSQAGKLVSLLEETLNAQKHSHPEGSGSSSLRS